MASEVEEDWTPVGKKRENKSGGQNKTKKNHESQGPKRNNFSKTKGKDGKGVKHNAPPAKSKPEPRVERAPSADSSMILASKSDEAIEKKEPAVVLTNPWTNTPKFSETVFVSQGIKDLQIDLNTNSIRPEDFARICRSFDVKDTRLAKFHARFVILS